MRDLRKTRRRCEDLVRHLDLPPAGSVQELCATIAQRRQRPIRLLPTTFPDTALCGLWIATESADYLVYEQATSELHQEHIILHELGHLLCGHDLGGRLDGGLFAALDAGAVRGMLGRTNYSTVEEREAELTASLIRGRCGLRPPSNTARETAVGERIRRTLAHGSPPA